VKNKVKILDLAKYFLVFLSGADPKILNRAECRGEQRIYQAVGMNIAIISTCAFIFASYAFHSILENVGNSLLIGAFWCFAIAMISRFLVTTTNKQTQLCWSQLIVVASRFVLASLFAIVISKPLEMAIYEYEKEIRAAIEDLNGLSAVLAVGTASAAQNQQTQKRVDHDERIAGSASKNFEFVIAEIRADLVDDIQRYFTHRSPILPESNEINPLRLMRDALIDPHPSPLPSGERGLKASHLLAPAAPLLPLWEKRVRDDECHWERFRFTHNFIVALSSYFLLGIAVDTIRQQQIRYNVLLV
jgi:Domain of unknown function (DUF4407)